MTCRIRGGTRLQRHKEGRRTVAAIMCADHKEQLELLDHKRLQSASCLTVVNITPVQSEEDAFCRSFDAAGSSVLLVGNLQSLQTRISFDKVCFVLHQPAGWPCWCRGASKNSHPTKSIQRSSSPMIYNRYRRLPVRPHPPCEEHASHSGQGLISSGVPLWAPAKRSLYSLLQNRGGPSLNIEGKCISFGWRAGFKASLVQHSHHQTRITRWQGDVIACEVVRAPHFTFRSSNGPKPTNCAASLHFLGSLFFSSAFPHYMLLKYRRESLQNLCFDSWFIAPTAGWFPNSTLEGLVGSFKVCVVIAVKGFNDTFCLLMAFPCVGFWWRVTFSSS